MAKINITHDDGEKTIEVASGTLMDALRDEGFVDGTCGGAASCGTCHVYIGEEWVEKCGARTEDEGYMLESLEELVEIKDGSRLCCQIAVDERLDGLKLQIGPQF